MRIGTRRSLDSGKRGPPDCPDDSVGTCSPMRRVLSLLIPVSIQLTNKVPSLPQRSLPLLGQVVAHQETDLHELHRRIEIQGLIHIVAGRVVPGCNPVLKKLPAVRAAGLKTKTRKPETRRERRIKIGGNGGKKGKSFVWCREGDLNPHNPCGSADFKSAASASFAIPARFYFKPKALAANLRE